MSDSFMKLLYDSYNKNPIAPDDFKKKNIYDVSRKKISDIINDIINKLLSEKSNIYTDLNKKNILLNHK